MKNLMNKIVLALIMGLFVTNTSILAMNEVIKEQLDTNATSLLNADYYKAESIKIKVPLISNAAIQIDLGFQGSVPEADDKPVVDINLVSEQQNANFFSAFVSDITLGTVGFFIKSLFGMAKPTVGNSLIKLVMAYGLKVMILMCNVAKMNIGLVDGSKELALLSASFLGLANNAGLPGFVARIITRILPVALAKKFHEHFGQHVQKGADTSITKAVIAKVAENKGMSKKEAEKVAQTTVNRGNVFMNIINPVINVIKGNIVKMIKG